MLEAAKGSNGRPVSPGSARLAELGIDPAGMTCNDLLRQYYARSQKTAQGHANMEAERRVNVRAQTPRSFEHVFTTQAHQEVRFAQSKVPVINVHQSLDKWEIDVLADVCRAVRHYDEEGRGHTTEYMRHFEKRQYGSVPDRKKWVRKPV